MPYTRPFSALSKDDAASAGGKGASLGEMLSAGIPVPDGFVVLADTFDAFLRETDLVQEIDAILERVDPQAIHTVEAASKSIQSLILSRDIPATIKDETESAFRKLGAEFVAVRSSATAEDGAEHAWAGQLESYLNTTEAALLGNVKKCWASLFTPRAIFYRFEKGLHVTRISVAVVVQKMVESEKSGIAFSVHPVTEDRNQMIIEAGFGLGEAIVSGSVTPDSYVIEKSPRRIIDVNVNRQTKALSRKRGGGNEWQELGDEGATQVLSEEEILELSAIVLRIEDHYGFPCDIEWAEEGGGFFITQSRPITTLTALSEEALASSEKFSNWLPGATRNVSLWFQWLSSLGHFHHAKDFGVEAPLRQLALTKNGTETLICVDRESLAKYTDSLFELLGTREGIGELKAAYQAHAEALFRALEGLDEANPEKWKVFTDALRRFSAGLYLSAVIGRAGMERLTALLEERGVPARDIPETLGVITYPEEHTPLYRSQLDLLEIGAQVQAGISEGKKMTLLEEWIEKYGAIPVNFCDEPWTLSDAEEQLEEMLQKDCARALEEAEEKQEKRLANKARRLAELDDERLSVLAEAMAEGTYLNEFRKNVISRALLKIRGILTNVAKAGGSEDWRDSFFLTPDEVQQLVAGEKLDIAALKKERERAAYYTDENGENVFLSPEETEELLLFFETAKAKHSPASKGIVENSGNEVRGFSANKGKAAGTARVILSSKDFGRMGRGDILVATMTSVDFVPIMERAGAIVTDEGGITCHAAIVSRELGVPSLIGTGNATRVIKDGDRVEVDAVNGVVRILEKGDLPS